MVHDVNGIRIMEGDIVSHEKDYDKDCWPDDSDGTYIAKSIVRYSKGSFVIGDPGDHDFLYLAVWEEPEGSEHWRSGWHTVIGNIWDNPELIKECN